MAKSKSSRKIDTIEGLARLIQTEFLGVHNEFSGVHKKLGSLESRVGLIESEVHDMKSNFNELFTKLDAFISLYRDAKQEISVLYRHVKRLEERVAQLEARR